MPWAGHLQRHHSHEGTDPPPPPHPHSAASSHHQLPHGSVLDQVLLAEPSAASSTAAALTASTFALPTGPRALPPLAGPGTPPRHANGRFTSPARGGAAVSADSSPAKQGGGDDARPPLSHRGPAPPPHPLHPAAGSSLRASSPARLPPGVPLPPSGLHGVGAGAVAARPPLPSGASTSRGPSPMRGSGVLEGGSGLLRGAAAHVRREQQVRRRAVWAAGRGDGEPHR